MEVFERFHLDFDWRRVRTKQPQLQSAVEFAHHVIEVVAIDEVRPRLGDAAGCQYAAVLAARKIADAQYMKRRIGCRFGWLRHRICTDVRLHAFKQWFGHSRGYCKYVKSIIGLRCTGGIAASMESRTSC